MRRPRASGEVSFFLYWLCQYKKNETNLSTPCHVVIALMAMPCHNVRRAAITAELFFLSVPISVTQISLTTKWLHDGSHQRVS